MFILVLLLLLLTLQKCSVIFNHTKMKLTRIYPIVFSTRKQTLTSAFPLKKCRKLLIFTFVQNPFITVFMSQLVTPFKAVFSA